MTKDGEPRKNPVRNQIDYIIVRNQHRRFITNSRSYNGINTNTDHKLVKMSMKIEWYKIRSRQTKTEKIDVGGLSEFEKRREYKTKISNEIEKARQKSSVQEKWDAICEICKGVGKEVLGLRKRITEHKDDKLAELTSKAKVIRKDIESTISIKQKKEKNEKVKQIKTQINKRTKEIEENKLERYLDAIENSKDDSTRYYKAMRAIQRRKKAVPLCVKDEAGAIACTEEQQIRIIREHFKTNTSSRDWRIPPHRLPTMSNGNSIHRRRDQKSR